MKARRLPIRYARCWEETFGLLRVPVVALPFLILALIQAVVLTLFAYFPQKPFSFFMVPVVEGLFGDKALHYPANFLMLPDMFLVMRPPILVLFGFVLFAWAVFMMVDVLRGRKVYPMRYGALLAWNFVSLVTIGGSFALVGIGCHQLANLAVSVAGGRFEFLVLLVSQTVLFAPLVYSLVFLKYFNNNSFAALKSSFDFARKRFALTALVIATMLLLQRPLDSLLSDTSRMAVDYGAESIYYVMLADIGVKALTYFYLFASTTYLVLGRRKETL